MIPEDFVPPDLAWPIVLGIDPGTRVLGYGALVIAPQEPRLLCCGVLEAPRGKSIDARLGYMAEGLEQLFVRLRPVGVALESAFASRNVQSALRLGEARGVVLAAAGRRGIPVRQFAPSTAKKAVLGNGAASKEQVARTLVTILGPKVAEAPLDASDALALALAWVHRRRSEDLLGRR